MFVARIILRVLGGVGEKALYWRFGGRAAKSGHIINWSELGMVKVYRLIFFGDLAFEIVERGFDGFNFILT